MIFNTWKIYLSYRKWKQIHKFNEVVLQWEKLKKESGEENCKTKRNKNVQKESGEEILRESKKWDKVER